MSQNGWRRGMEFEAHKSLERALVKAIFDGERIVTLSGEALPLLRAGAQVEIHIPTNDFVDPEQARLYVASKSVELLPAGTRLFAIVKGLPERDGFASPSSIEHPLSPAESQDREYVRWGLEQMHRIGIAHGVEPNNPEGAVEVVLNEPLRLTLRGDKKPRLEHCYCEIPYFTHAPGRPDAQAHSLNHAFTLISEHFETSRISHTGNAFMRFFVNDGTRFQRLDMLARFIDENKKNETTSPMKDNMPSAMTLVQATAGDAKPTSISVMAEAQINALYDELVLLCKAGLAWARKNGYPEVENYPQYPRAREIWELLNAEDGLRLMQQAVHHVYAHVNSPDGGQAALLEYGWSGIGNWQS